MRKKPISKVVSIDSLRSNSAGDQPEPPEGGPVSVRPQKRFYSDPMTRRAFAGLFFGMAMNFSKAALSAACTPTAASEELHDLGYEEWKRRTGRAA